MKLTEEQIKDMKDFIIMRELQYQEKIGHLNENGLAAIVMLQMDESLRKMSVKTVLTYINHLLKEAGYEVEK